LINISILINIIIYFLWNLNSKAELDQPQQLIVPDVDDIFIPINDGFLVDIEKSK